MFTLTHAADPFNFEKLCFFFKILRISNVFNYSQFIEKKINLNDH